MVKIPFFGESWISDGNADFSMTENYAEIVCHSEVLARFRCFVDCIEKNCTYVFSAQCIMLECKSSISPYAMISQYRADGTCIIRMYAQNDDTEPWKKQLEFFVGEECTKITVELGLKGGGKVRWLEPSLDLASNRKPRKVKIAATRLSSSKTTAEAMEKIERAVDSAGTQNTDVIILGEGINDMGCSLTAAQSAQDLDGGFCSLIREKAIQYNTYVVMNFHEKDDERIFNTSILIDRNGNVAGKYRKTHLSLNEYEQGISPGDELPVFDTDFGKVGMLICWDMYFPEPARIMAMKGAELILVSTAGDPSVRHVSRALENGIYVAVSGCMLQNLNNCGIEPSKVIAPDGTVLAQTNTEGESAIAEIDLNDKRPIYWLSAAGAYTVPNNIYLNERRPDLYTDICGGKSI